MKKVFLKGYLNDNLGDDLFIHIISERYKKISFYIVSYKKIQAIFNENIKIYQNRFNKTANKLIKSVSLLRTNLERIISNKCEANILIGGSMFIEKDNSRKEYNIGNNKAYYILGTNFGPYKSKEYYYKFYNIFSKAEDVCFREKYSYDLFKNLNNVRYTCDMVFSLDTSSIRKTENKNVIISVIDCAQKQNIENKEKYEKIILKLIQKFDKLKYSITLMSFCKNEGDEDAIKSILSKIKTKKLKDKIKQYNYRGNIKEALNILGNAQIIIGSRFHANILGLVMNKTILPIAYSDKTINTLKDINYKGKIIDIRHLDNFNVNNITEEDLNYKIDIEKYRKQAEKHFEKLDKILK